MKKKKIREKMKTLFILSGIEPAIRRFGERPFTIRPRIVVQLKCQIILYQLWIYLTDY